MREKRLGIAAEKGTEVREVAPDCIMELKKAGVKMKKNRFTSAAVIQKEHGKRSCFRSGVCNFCGSAAVI